MAADQERVEIRIATPADYAAIEACSRAADPAEVTSPLTSSLATWFAERQPDGPGFIVIARDRARGELVGHFVFYRWTLMARDGHLLKPVAAALYVRLYVQPPFRRQGIFRRMNEFGLEELGRRDVVLAYTAPNPRSSLGFVRMGMTRLGPLPFWVRPNVRGWQLVQRARAGRGVEVEPAGRFTDSFDEAVAEGLPKQVRYWSSRTAVRLNWRFFDRPDATYKLYHLRDGTRRTGYLVVRRMSIKGRPTLVICDFWAEAFAGTALAAGVDAALADGDRVQLVVAVGGTGVPRLRAALWRAGFLPCPGVLLPQPVVIFGAGIGSGASRMTLPAENSWYLGPYDWDVF